MKQKLFISRRGMLKRLGLGLSAGILMPGCVPGQNRCSDGPEAPAKGSGYSETGAPSAQRLLEGIDTYIVLFMENRSFDHMLGMLAFDSDYVSRAVVDGLRGNEENTDDDGTVIKMRRAPEIPTHGPAHHWIACHEAHGEGVNNGFVKANEGRDKTDAMTYLTREDIPLMYSLADQFTVCDRWFSSVMGPTWPNRFYLHAATSLGIKTNNAIVDGPATVWEQLGKKCWSCKNYAAGPAHWYHAAFRGRAFSGNDPFPAGRIEDFFRDARAGNLPNFSLIDPDFWSNDFHPPHSLALSEALVGSVVRAVQESPQYKRSMLIITFDENGGFYDHVAPPKTADSNKEFQQLGFRVPAIVIGPSVRRGQVVSQLFEHVSIAKTLQTRFGIESLNERMDAAADLSACIDPELMGLAPGPLAKLPKLRIDRKRIVEAPIGYSSQPWIDQAIAEGVIPERLLDKRSHDERLRSVLRQAEELDVAEVLG